jgi:uncharacterized membrane protein YfcA
MDFDIALILLWISAILIKGISKSGFAGSMGMVAVPLLSLRVDPLEAAAIMLPILIFMDWLSLKKWWGQHNKVIMKLLLPKGFIGVLIGYLTYQYLDQFWILLGVGVMSIIFGIATFIRPLFEKLKFPTWVGHLLGLISGYNSFCIPCWRPSYNNLPSPTTHY